MNIHWTQELFCRGCYISRQEYMIAKEIFDTRKLFHLKPPRRLKLHTNVANNISTMLCSTSRNRFRILPNNLFFLTRTSLQISIFGRTISQITLRHWRTSVNMLHIFTTPSPRKASRWLLLNVVLGLPYLILEQKQSLLY